MLPATAPNEFPAKTAIPITHNVFDGYPGAALQGAALEYLVLGAGGQLLQLSCRCVQQISQYRHFSGNPGAQRWIHVGREHG
jgi:hypothetical protein